MKVIAILGSPHGMQGTAGPIVHYLLEGLSRHSDDEVSPPHDPLRADPRAHRYPDP